MSVYKNTSWGRTRSPKNVAGPPGSTATVLANTNTLKGVTASTVGYATENQRFLHVLVTDANESTSLTVTVFGYCHAFQRWFEIPETNLASANTAATAASIVVGDSGAAPVDQTPDAREYRLYHTVGVDRVAFVGTDADVNVFAAGSTF
mgnify:FL=1|jgi:hypothetical protein